MAPATSARPARGLRAVLAVLACAVAGSAQAAPRGALPVEEATFCLAFLMTAERIHAAEGRSAEVARVRSKTVPLFRALSADVGRGALSEAVSARWREFEAMHERLSAEELRAFAARSEADCDALLAAHGIGGSAGGGGEG